VTGWFVAPKAKSTVALAATVPVALIVSLTVAAATGVVW